MGETRLGSSKVKLYLGNTKIRKAYLGNTLVYSAGAVVTYCVDAGTTYTEEVDEGASCLSPKSFTPAKSGWGFVGWRQDTAAGGSVLSSLSMGDTPVTLYAVFRQTVIVTYYNGSTSASSTSKYRYYNNGNVFNPSFTLTQAALSGWTARGWSIYNDGNSSITYNNGATFTTGSSITLNGMYQQNVTLTTVANGVSSAATKVRSYNSGSGATVNPTFTVANPSKSNATFLGWSSSASSTAVANSSISNLALAASATRYALFKYADSSMSGRPQYYNNGQGSNSSGTVTIDNTYPVYNDPQYGGITYIDCSAYSAITISNLSGSVGTSHRGDTVSLYLKAGQNTVLLATAINGYGNADNTAVDQSFSGAKTITLNQADGNSPLTARLVITPGYAGGYLWRYNINAGFTIALTGRTTIG